MSSEESTTGETFVQDNVEDSFELKNKSLFDIILRVFCRIKLINVVGCRIYFSLDSECSKLIRGIYLLYTLTTHNTIKIASL